MRVARRLFCVLVALLIEVPPVAAQAPATLTGVLTDQNTAAPLYGVGFNVYVVRIYHQNGTSAGSGVTDPSGRYTISGITPGTYFVRAEPPPPTYMRELYDSIDCVAADCVPTVGTPVVLGAGMTTTIDFALSMGAAFSGTVRRSDGSPIAGVQIDVFNAAGSFVTRSASSSNGIYLLTAVPPGTYFVRASPGNASPVDFIGELFGGAPCSSMPPIPDGGCRITSGTPVVVTSASTLITVDFFLDVMGSISGTVTDSATAQPLTNARVVAYNGGVVVGSAQTNGTGQYSMNVPTGTYQVRTEVFDNHVDEWSDGLCVGCPGTAATVNVTNGAATTGVNFALAPGGVISGTITCTNLLSSDWLQMPRFFVYNTSGELVKTVPRPGGCLATTPSTAYQIPGLATGQYFIAARDEMSNLLRFPPAGGSLIDQLYPGLACVTVDCDVRRGVPVSVTAGVTTPNINFSMVRGADSSFVELSLARSLRLFDSRGIELTNVVRALFDIGFSGQQFVGVPPGTYYASFGERVNGAGACSNCPPTSGQPIVIAPGQRSFQLDLGGPTIATSVAGIVRDDPGGNRLSTITVEIYTDAGRLAASAVTDLAGRYGLTGIGPGTYFLRTKNDRGFVDEMFGGGICVSCDARSGTPVVVGSADVTDVDFALGAGGFASGAVVNTNSVGQAGGVVSYFTSAGELAGRATTLAGGGYRLTLPPGGYRARVEATTDHAAEVFSEQPCTSAACDVAAGTAISVSAGVETTHVDFTPAACSAMTLSPPILASAVAGRSYRQVFTVTGGVGPMSFAVTSGSLPLGVTMTADGVLSGTPTAPGRHDIVVSAIDTANCGTSRALSIEVQGCTFNVSPSSVTVSAAGGVFPLTITDPCGLTTFTSSSDFVTRAAGDPMQFALEIAANTAAASRSATVTIGRRVVAVNQGGVAASLPFGAIDAPAQGAQISGSVALGGWALDDLDVRRVQIYRDPIGGEVGQVYLGDAVFVTGARPDVRAAYPTYPRNDRAGWGFQVLTNMLPGQGNGVFQFHAYADDFEGNRVLLGSRTIVANNTASVLPFGAIDTPAQGATIAGASYINFGWALTPQPKIIPTDGSTIHVMIDGMPVGSPVYNQFRGDIAAFFPGLANSNGAVGYRTIDTTALAEGQHTIAWIVYDNLNAGDGIGSRYFTVANSADAPGASAGIEAGQRTESLAVTQASAGARRVRLKATDRLELRLETSEADGACPATWAGYRVDDETLGDLPVGASIDRTGTFYWQPGPSFKGKFDLIFIRTSCDGSKKRSAVTVVIDSK